MNDDKRRARKRLFLQMTLAILTGWLCCITPLVLVLLGVASLSSAVSLDHVLNGEYAWAFRGAALVFVAVAVVVYFRRRGVCTLDQARRQRNGIINITFLALLFAVAGYMAFWYLLGYWGAAVGLPWRPRRWELLSSGVLLGAAVLLQLTGRLLRRTRGQAPAQEVHSSSDTRSACQ